MSAEDNIRRALESSFMTKRKIFGEDVCDILGPALAEGGASGDSVSLEVIATNVDCFIVEISGGQQRQITGGEAVISTHRIEMKRSAVLEGLTLQYRLRAHPRGDKVERIFEKLKSAVATHTPLTVVEATLVKQGYQQ